ncbi:polysaccharide biosynthesis/export family protein [Erythrobacter ani]|uniref:Polysaccharide export protein n=1 Tax=Erythrobacter ani TaxID=2827235 RepID=A0ABS6SMN5_9SPHN|nr:polysaccharide biosynthesis/export family protein [Erythrobacter ani]MBV7266314.1 polysaccharide export protein [Erythrobacter ani]
MTIEACIRAWASVRTLLLGGLCVLAAGCASSGLTSISAADANSGLAEGYSIDAGDQLRVTVFDEETLTGEFDVGAGGILSLPLIDPLLVKDKGPQQVAEMVEKSLADGGYVLDPRVSVEIIEHRTFFILGEVATPGEYTHNGELSLEQAIAKAGGFTPRADKDKIVLKRQTWSEGRIVKLDKSALRIAPGDTITIRESFF